MKRLLFGILICFLLGAITTVVVAWRCRYTLPPFDRLVQPPPTDAWPQIDATTAFIQPDAEDVAWLTAQGWRPNAPALRFRTVTASFGKEVIEYSQDARSLVGHEYGYGAMRTGWPHLAIETGYRHTAILPRGFLLNTLYYGVFCLVLWQLNRLAWRVIQQLRTHEGHCPKCNYDLRGELDKGCSECGWGRDDE